MTVDVHQVEWLSDWDRQIEPAKQRQYILNEMYRLQELGVPLLTKALLAPFIEQTDLAVSCLHEMGYTPYLRLKEGQRPPERDPDARLLPPADKGKVLLAKVGVVGQTDDGRQPASEDDPFNSGTGRVARARLNRPNTKTARVTREPMPYPLKDAKVILQQWGFHVVPPVRARDIDEATGKSKLPFDKALVEEVRMDVAQPTTTDASKHSSGKRAA